MEAADRVRRNANPDGNAVDHGRDRCGCNADQEHECERSEVHKSWRDLGQIENRSNRCHDFVVQPGPYADG